MTTMTEEELQGWLTEGNGDQPFRPFLHYDKGSDSLEFIGRPGAFDAERVDGLLTVYCSHETKEVVGALIKDLRRIVQSPLFELTVKDGKVRLSVLLVGLAFQRHGGAILESRRYEPKPSPAAVFASPALHQDDEAIHRYKSIKDLAEESDDLELDSRELAGVA